MDVSFAKVPSARTFPPGLESADLPNIYNGDLLFNAFDQFYLIMQRNASDFFRPAPSRFHLFFSCSFGDAIDTGFNQIR